MLILRGGVSKPTKIFITVDVEGDWSLFPSEQKYFDVEIILKNLNVLDGLLAEAKELNSIDIPITWFLRCDASVKTNLGSYDGLLKKLDKFIDKKTQEGDVFGIHPHLYSMDTTKQNNDLNEDEINDQLSEAFLSWSNFFGLMPKFSRIGEARMDNFIASQLHNYDIEIDSSALPGRVRNDNGFNFDWSRASNKAYRPSISDYQVSSENNNHNFLELPFTMIPTKGSQDSKIINRYFNLSFKHKIIDDALDIMPKSDEIVCVVHPHEIASKQGFKHDIISYDGDSFLKNINRIQAFSDEVTFCHF